MARDDNKIEHIPPFPVDAEDDGDASLREPEAQVGPKPASTSEVGTRPVDSASVGGQLAKSSQGHADAMRSLTASMSEIGESLKASKAEPGQSPEVAKSKSGESVEAIGRVVASLEKLAASITAERKGEATRSPDKPLAASIPSPVATRPAPAASPTGNTDWNRDEGPSVSQSSIVPGLQTGRDSVNAVLRPGEAVIRKEAVAAIGPDKLEELNNQLQVQPEPATLPVDTPLAKKPVTARSRQSNASVGVKRAGHFAGAIAAAARAVGAAGRGIGKAASAAGRGIGKAAKATKAFARKTAVSRGTARTAARIGKSGVAFLRNDSATPDENTEMASVGSKMASSAMGGAQMGAAAGAPGMLIGAAVGAVVGGFKAVGEAAKEASVKLAKYSGHISAANAQAEVKQITGDISRAGLVGKDVAKYTESTSKVSQSNQDLGAVFMKVGLALMNPILEVLAPIREFATSVMIEFIANVLEAMATLMDYADGWSGATDKQQAYIREIVKEVKKFNEDKEAGKEGIDIDGMMNQFLSGGGMGGMGGGTRRSLKTADANTEFGLVNRQGPGVTNDRGRQFGGGFANGGAF